LSVARTITIADDALQDALSKGVTQARKKLVDVARELLAAAAGDLPRQVRFGTQRGPQLFTESVNAWQRALRQRKQLPQ
jgi:hypothetical protein